MLCTGQSTDDATAILFRIVLCCREKLWISIDKFEKQSRIKTFLELHARKINDRIGKLPKILGNLSIPCGI